MLAHLAAALLLAATPVQVEAENCPSGRDIEPALASMLPPMPEGRLPDVARVVHQGDRLQIELINADAAVIAERWFDQTGTCADRAALVAVVIASWESDVHPEFARPHAEPIPAAAVAAPAANQDDRGTVPVDQSFDLAAGPTLSLADSLAVGGSIAATWVARGTGLGANLSAAGETARTLNLAGAQANWRRWAIATDADWRLASGRATLDIHGGLALGLLSANGARFDRNRSTLSFAPGARAGARLSWWLTRNIAVCLDVAGIYWLRQQIVYAQPVPAQQDVPRFQGVAMLGVAVGRAPSPR
jgi:hypothetical protein